MQIESVNFALYSAGGTLVTEGYLGSVPQPEVVVVRRKPGKPAGPTQAATVCAWLERRIKRQHRHEGLFISRPQARITEENETCVITATCRAVGIPGRMGEVYWLSDDLGLPLSVFD